MLKIFSRYTVIGILNTILHWSVFYILTGGFHQSQSISNLVAFLVAVSFSFFANSRWTFAKKITTTRYYTWVAFMGSMALFFGWLGDKYNFPALITLAAFSAISLILGFIFARFIVFREGK